MTTALDRVLCHCGRPARGEVSADELAGAHFCRQCSPEHCLIREHLRDVARS